MRYKIGTVAVLVGIEVFFGVCRGYAFGCDYRTVMPSKRGSDVDDIDRQRTETELRRSELERAVFVGLYELVL